MSATLEATRITAIPEALPDDLLEQIRAGAVERELTRTLPFEAVAALDELGFGALRIPAEHGGGGLSIEQFITQLIRLAAADTNVAHLYRGHVGFVESLRFQAPAVRERWYRWILAGATIGNASTEIGGNAVGTLNTRLTRAEGAEGREGGWVLNGEKFYSTGTLYATHTRVSASREGEAGRCFAVVPTDAPGVRVVDDWDGFGQRLTGTGTTQLVDVAVAADDVLERVRGTHEAIHEASYFQLHLLAVQVGGAKAALRDTVETIRARTRTFNTAHGGLFRDDAQIQQVVGEQAAKLFAAEAAVLEVARIHDRTLAVGYEVGTWGERADAEAAAAGRSLAEVELPEHVRAELLEAELATEKAQVLVPELCLAAVGDLFRTVGASAVARGKALDRHWRNLQTVSTHNPAVFRARSVGDHALNGTLPEGLNAIGEATRG
ncbi:MAG: acyl-CoA dehydrogenase family protein [Micrococcus sp.]|nr:acyl-CoA dehydrogenase family protein [Micrococcus sp.]